MLSEFEKKMLSLTGVNNDSKTKQLMNFMKTQHSRKVYISEDEYKNTLLGTWLKKNGLNKEDGTGFKTNTNYLLKMSKQAILKYANYFVEKSLYDVYLSGSYAKKSRIEKGKNTFSFEAIGNIDGAYAFDFYKETFDENFLFFYSNKTENAYDLASTENDIIEKPLDYIELEFEYYEGISEMYSQTGDYTIFDYIAINEPQRQYIDDRGLFEVRNGEDGHFYALVLSYVDETSIKYLVMSHTGAITLFDPENDAFKSLEDLETVDGENAMELEDVFKAVANAISNINSVSFYELYVADDNTLDFESVKKLKKLKVGDIVVIDGEDDPEPVMNSTKYLCVVNFIDNNEYYFSVIFDMTNDQSIGGSIFVGYNDDDYLVSESNFKLLGTKFYGHQVSFTDDDSGVDFELTLFTTISTEIDSKNVLSYVMSDTSTIIKNSKVDGDDVLYMTCINSELIFVKVGTGNLTISGTLDLNSQATLVDFSDTVTPL